jgi:hypothetical protein
MENSIKEKDFYTLSEKNQTDKVTYHGYHFFYPRYLESLRNQRFKMLEIGYHTGSSVRMWKEYFPYADVYCMDINVEGYLDGCNVIKGDQSNIDDLSKVKDIVESCKFIIDDGSHHPLHQIETFEYLFSNLLDYGGIYIIEDIETNYWRSDSSVYGYKIGLFDAIKYSSKFIDMINQEFSGIKNSLHISSISYGQNCIIITKQTEEEIAYFDREYRFKTYL